MMRKSAARGRSRRLRPCAHRLAARLRRDAPRRCAKEKALEERIKWGHLVYFANGPVLLIRAEESRVLFGFWRGQRLRAIEPRLKPGGKYEMATLELREGMTIKPAVATRLAREAVALNGTVGDPTKGVKKAKVGRVSAARHGLGRRNTLRYSALRTGLSGRARGRLPALSPASSSARSHGLMAGRCRCTGRGREGRSEEVKRLGDEVREVQWQCLNDQRMV